MTLHCQPLNGRRPVKTWRNHASNGSPLSGCTVTVIFTWSVREVTWLKPSTRPVSNSTPTSVIVAHATLPPPLRQLLFELLLVAENSAEHAPSVTVYPRPRWVGVFRNNCLTQRQSSRERGRSDPPVDTQTTAAAEDLSDWEGRPGSLLWNDGGWLRRLYARARQAGGLSPIRRFTKSRGLAASGPGSTRCCCLRAPCGERPPPL